MKRKDNVFQPNKDEEFTDEKALSLDILYSRNK
jgi:hypothetical protein